MKQIIYILIFVFSANIYSQTKLYVHPDGDNYAANTETIALLPLKVQVKLRPKQLKDFTPETWRYKIGAWRFFYEIDEDEKIVSLLAASHRSSAY